MQEKILTKVLRISLGVILFVFGLNKILNFLPTPVPPMETMAYWGGLMSSSYILPTVMVIEILAGVSLILNRFVPLALILLTPVTYNIFMYHLMLDTAGLSIPLALLIGQILLFYNYKEKYNSLLKA